MSNCSNCGENTKLHVMGEPTCVKCVNANPGERRVRKPPGEAVGGTSRGFGWRSRATSEETTTNHLAEVAGIRRGS